MKHAHQPGVAYRYLVPIISLAIFGILFTVSVKYWKLQSELVIDQLVADDIEQLVAIFKRIDETCKIIDFEHEKNYIDFLTVKDFVGSEVGSMNLVYPSGWEGPYLDDNPTIQEKYYVILNTKNGYFIVPGDGVELSNGKVVGKDLILDKDSDIPQLMRDPQGLLFGNRAMAAPLKLSGSKMQQLLQKNLLPVTACNEEVDQGDPSTCRAS